MTTLTQKYLGVDGGQYSRVILLIVESGALIAAAKIVEFTLFKLAPVDGLHGLNALYIVYEIMPQITVSAGALARGAILCGVSPVCIGSRANGYRLRCQQRFHAERRVLH